MNKKQITKEFEPSFKTKKKQVVNDEINEPLSPYVSIEKDRKVSWDDKEINRPLWHDIPTLYDVLNCKK